MRTRKYFALTAALAVTVLLAGCSGATPSPKSAPPSGVGVPSVAALMKADKAPASATPAYKAALATLAAACAESSAITFSVDSDASNSSQSRLQIMQQVAASVNGKKGQDCTTAVLDAASGTPVIASTPTADAPSYLLGTAATTRTPVPDCALAVAFWTAATGHMVVNVFNVPGPTTVTALVTLRSGATQTFSASIAGGQDAHDFQLTDTPPAQVASVKISATTDNFGTGGSCMATGGPDA